ncbi:aminopeptidase [Fluviispira sanaruensis]|uniref:Aminopeptidase n=1 Tax=Fluviispira sanaruensis TaxID=2493639 RepID=A0A4P2VJJ6_FLUSA|nr:aminopeptidase [Fluviispira sanaruensis]BBH52881.1 aminopeptidase [Fluviispira sanaruensis]
MKIGFIIATSFLFSGCYSISQGYGQVKLLMKQEPIKDVIKENKETEDRLKKLKIVQPILDFAQAEIGLTPGGSYQKYIALDKPYVSWIVQAARKRSLELKTWWFPFVGSQPYLGYFEKENALEMQKTLINDGYDTVSGGVSAFSLLGYYPDPLYSSIIDNSTVPDFIETIIHESLHRTIYIPNYYAFNENLADFIAKKATVIFLKKNQNIGENPALYEQQYLKNQMVQKKFQTFLNKTKKELDTFYQDIANHSEYVDEEKFLLKREMEFNRIAGEYKKYMNGLEIGTSYEHSFQKGKINNALILAYSVYESKQEPFEIALKNADGNLKQLVKNLELCFSTSPQDEQDLWQKVVQCKTPSSLKE